jgi:hypothetical protein
MFTLFIPNLYKKSMKFDIKQIQHVVAKLHSTGVYTPKLHKKDGR